jgi:hypothetical protein
LLDDADDFELFEQPVAATNSVRTSAAATSSG